jgi:hypothetical protein
MRCNPRRPSDDSPPVCMRAARRRPSSQTLATISVRHNPDPMNCSSIHGPLHNLRSWFPSARVPPPQCRRLTKMPRRSQAVQRPRAPVEWRDEAPVPVGDAALACRTGQGINAGTLFAACFGGNFPWHSGWQFCRALRVRDMRRLVEMVEYGRAAEKGLERQSVNIYA